MSKRSTKLGLVTFLVRDYDEAISWFCENLAFDLIEDTQITPEKRWVTVAPGGGGASCFWQRPMDRSR